LLLGFKPVRKLRKLDSALAALGLVPEKEMEMVASRARLPIELPLLVALDGDGSAFPRLDLTAAPRDVADPNLGQIMFPERTRLQLEGCCGRGVLTLEPGSRFDCLDDPALRNISVEGGELILRGANRFVEVRASQAVITMTKQPGRLYPMALHTTIPALADPDLTCRVNVSQRRPNGPSVGGAGVVYLFSTDNT
jgi:hypothetical protein